MTGLAVNCMRLVNERNEKTEWAALTKRRQRVVESERPYNVQFMTVVPIKDIEQICIV